MRDNKKIDIQFMIINRTNLELTRIRSPYKTWAVKFFRIIWWEIPFPNLFLISRTHWKRHILNSKNALSNKAQSKIWFRTKIIWVKLFIRPNRLEQRILKMEILPRAWWKELTRSNLKGIKLIARTIKNFIIRKIAIKVRNTMPI